MSVDLDLEDRVSQDDWTIQPTHRHGEYLLSHDGMHACFHAARATSSDGVRQVDIVQHGNHDGVVVATVNSANVPWRIDEWLRSLAAQTVPEVDQ